MTYQTLQTLSQGVIALGLIMAALGGYGAYYYQKKIDSQKEKPTKPVIDLCHRGISVTEVGDGKLYFDIPYCSGKNSNAYNFKLALFLRSPMDSRFLRSSRTVFQIILLLATKQGNPCPSAYIR